MPNDKPISQEATIFRSVAAAEVRKIVHGVLTETQARVYGIFGSGSYEYRKVERKGGCFSLTVRSDLRQTCPLHRHWQVAIGSRSLIIELMPGHNSPDYLAARITTGRSVKADYRVAATIAFRTVKNSGIFHRDYEEGISAIVRELVNVVIQMHS